MAVHAQLAEEATIGDDFLVVDRIGAGGMGVVYLAQQQSTGRMRALKVMSSPLGEDGKAHERFVREARVGALIHSEHVVEVIAAGVDRDGALPWIAMELLEGDDLAEHCSRGVLEQAEALEILGQIAHAIAAAHDADIVHRDIKPENVFVCGARSRDGALRVKVLDFGIAHVSRPGPSGATTAIGSPAWMAPEQAHTAKITPAADVWAFGLLAFWLLTGRMFWRASELEGVSVHAVLTEVLFADIPAASTRAAEVERGDRLPRGFDAWFARCVRRDPAERFAHAREAWEALDALDLSVPESLAPPPPSRAVSAHPGPVGGRVARRAALVAGGLAVGAILAWQLASREPAALAPIARGQLAPTSLTLAPAPPPALSSAGPAAPSAEPAAPNAGVAASARYGRPFNPKVAALQVNQRAADVSRVCGGMAGPPSFAGVVTFKPDGNASSVSFHDGQMGFTPKGACVRNHMASSHTEPYDGGRENVPFSVYVPN